MVLKVSQTLVRFSQALQCQQQQQGLWLWRISAMAMGTKVDGGANSGGIDHGSSGANNPAPEREALSGDMDKCYGNAYSTRSSDEGYGERYEEAVKVVLEKKLQQQQQQGVSNKRDHQSEGETVVNVQRDTSQGEHVEEEVSRHSTKETTKPAP